MHNHDVINDDILCMSKADNTSARNLPKFSGKFLYLRIDVQYPSNMTSTYNHRKLTHKLAQVYCPFVTNFI